MATPKEHIEEIRRKILSIGAKVENSLTEDHHETVKHLSAELYAKDVNFLMELIQNAEDNEYPERVDVDPSLEFIITSRDITKTGALATLIICNNEKGFSTKDIESICSATKKGNRKRSYSGEKGIGFKSVFLITSQPYIFSNGYKIRFNEEPCPHCKVGYVVPEWVEESPTLSEIRQIYGVGTGLPTTIIVLPLKPDKIKAVKDQLTSIHPEVLLFLSNIKKLSVKEDNVDPKLNTVNTYSISCETDFTTRKNIDAKSYTLVLSAEEKSNASNNECSYYIWKQKFPVKKQNRVERRMEIEEWVITLAFPHGERLRLGMMRSPGLYAVLPSKMVTSFPFIIQADFLLASSRESLLFGNKWNEGILSCVPTAFINAFDSLVKTSQNAPISCLPNLFKFLPVKESSFRELNNVRESIRLKLVDEDIVPCESYTSQRFILTSSFDQVPYDDILNFMGVKQVDFTWYAKCIQSSNLVLDLSEDVYLELLIFCSENWCTSFHYTNMTNIPILKYVSSDGCVSSCSIAEAKSQNGDINLLFSSEFDTISWLINCNKEFKCLKNHFFMPQSTQEAIRLCNNKEKILEWLNYYAGIVVVSVYEFAKLVLDKPCGGNKFVVAFVHLLFHSLKKDYMSEADVKKLCSILPLQDKYEDVRFKWQGVLVPACGSQWAALVDYNPWRDDGYIELGQVYMRSGKFAGMSTVENELLDFLKTYVGASDIPDLPPPNAEIRTMANPLTKSNALILLKWIKNLKYKSVRIPDTFLRSIKEGYWLKAFLGGISCYRPPSQSLMPGSYFGSMLQNGSVFVDIPLIDLQFYGDDIEEYTQELKPIGVMFEYGEACQFIGEHLMSMVAHSNVTKSNVFSILKFIKFLREKYLSPEKFINSIKDGKWMKTSHGYKRPIDSAFYDPEWKVASQICDIPFVDEAYYGEEIDKFETELKLLGVVIGFNQSYQLVSDRLKRSPSWGSLTGEAVILILRCLRYSKSSEKLVRAFKDVKFLNTSLGYRPPRETFLFDPEWGTLLQVFNCFPLIHTQFYGKDLLCYSKELKQLGVKVDFEEATFYFAFAFMYRATSIEKNAALRFLECYRKLKDRFHKSLDLKKCIKAKWLRTRLCDYRSPNECILFGSNWESIAPVDRLPFIDDTETYFGKSIYEYQKELKCMGVITNSKDGMKLITATLYLPVEPQVITSDSMMSILDCIRIILQEPKDSSPELLESFKKKLQKKWIKTSTGNRSPDQCMLFDGRWCSFLKLNDGPFIDNDFYSFDITSYEQELNAIGVTVDFNKGVEQISNNLYLHSDFTTIVRIYGYLNKVKWVPSKEAAGEIWIPNGPENGKWVNPNSCVLHDKDGLFESILNVLEKHYKQKLLRFFSRAFKVNSNPTVDDYCKLWNVWESSGRQLTHNECFAFWRYVSKHWSSETENNLRLAW